MGDAILDTQFMKLDESYNLAFNIHKNVTEKGMELMDTLKAIIVNLEEHWVSSDGVIHINHLIDGYNKFGVFFESMFKVTSDVVGYVVDVQSLRAATNGKNEVGSKVTASYQHIQLSELPDKASYHYDPLVQIDYKQLCSLATFFDSFINAVKDDSDSLLINWKSGIGHDDSVKKFEEFVTISTELRKYIGDAITELKTMIDNVNNNISKE